MVQINFASKELNCKVVFYGPGMSGKTTNLEIVHRQAPANNKGDLTSVATEGDRTLFFDFMPMDLGKVAGMQTRLQLYTVPGQVYLNATRKLVLQGVDGVIFVADSDPDKFTENLESYNNLVDNLKGYGKDLAELPHVIQFNKRDLPNAIPVENLDRAMNRFGVPTLEAVANKGEGVFQTLRALASLVLEKINAEVEAQLKNHGMSNPSALTEAPADPAPVAESTPEPAAEEPTPTEPAAVEPEPESEPEPVVEEPAISVSNDEDDEDDEDDEASGEDEVAKESAKKSKERAAGKKTKKKSACKKTASKKASKKKAAK